MDILGYFIHRKRRILFNVFAFLKLKYSISKYNKGKASGKTSRKI